MKRLLMSLVILIAACAAASAQVAKPSYVLSKGFFTLNGKIYNPDGSEFLLRGTSQNHYWGTESYNLNSIDGIAKTHANVVRVVMSNAAWQNQSRTPDKKRALVQKYIAKGLIPMVEQHDGTCDETTGLLDFITDIWTDPANVAWLNEYEAYVILNIANEWGPRDRTDAAYRAWRDAYKASITRIRDAGINNLLVIDSPDCGQGPRAMEVYGRELLDHDPQHNLVFSIHMYGLWRTGENISEVGQPNRDASPWLAEWELQTMLDLGLPVIVGEFSWSEASSVGYDTQRLMAFCHDRSIGWLAWSWNGNSDPLLDMAKGWDYKSDGDLYPFGNLIINHPRYGFRAASTRATVFGAPNRRPIVTLSTAAVEPFDVGSDITLNAEAADPDGQVTRVVFYHGEQKLGEASAPPYSFTWKNVARGRHELYAAAWDDAGQIGASDILELKVGYRPQTRRALLAVGDVALRPGDAAIAERLGMLGYEVQLADDNDVQAEQAQAYDLVLISATCVPTRVKTTLRDLAVPVLIWESQLFDDMSMTGSRLNTDYGREDGVAVAVVGKHPAGAGLSGKIAVYSKPDRVNWALPSASAKIIAVSPTNDQRPVLFIYDRGDQMIDRPAPAGRAAFFLQDDSAALLTIDGWRLFDASVDYLAATDTDVASRDERVSEFALAQNYPNPFNPETTIAFRLAQAAEVQLTVYNLKGQAIAQLTQGHRAAGAHRVIWNGRDDRGADAANGVYLYRLHIQEDAGVRRTLARKMTLLR